MRYGKNDIKFIRFGDLKSINQKDSFKIDSFHSAPTNKGIYAFVEFMIEPFLLGGYNKIGTKHSKRKYVKDENGNKVIIGRMFEDKSKPPVQEYDKHFEWYIHVDDDEMKNLEKRYGSKQKNLFINTGFNKDGYIYMTTLKKPKRFKYTGEIWHHLGDHVPNHLVLQRSKYWVLTDFQTYVKAFNKSLHSQTSNRHKWTWDKFKCGKPVILDLQMSKDMYEVFIEKIN